MSNVIPPQALSDLIGSIYDCALDPSRWDETLRNIRDALDGHIAFVTLINVERRRPLLMKTAGLKPGHLPMYLMHVNEIRDLMRSSFAMPIDEARVASRDLPPGYMDASPYFQACRKRGIVDIMQFILIHEAPNFFSGFSIQRHERQGVITDREIEIGKLLLPHLRRAMTISKMLDLRTIEGARMAQTLDALRCAVLLTDERGTILHANSAAERMLEDGGPIRSAKGILQAKLPSATSELHAALAVAAGDRPGVSRTGAAIRLTAPATQPVIAHILPLTGSDVPTRLEPSTVAAVFICGSVDEQDGAATAATAFGLTPAETRVLKNLLGGRTLAETATALGITRFTANAHLDHIFVKTGVSRQADLIRLVIELISPAGSNV